MPERIALVTLALVCGCTHGEPPTAKVDGSVAPIELSSPSPSPSPSPSTSTSTSTSPSPSPSPSTSTPTSTPTPPSDAGATDDIGEQTKDKPSVQNATFQARMKSLWDAIAEDKPEIARGAFFPVKAYEKVKAVGNPAGDWRVRLLAAYERDIHDLHLQLGARASRAHYVGIDVPEERGRWVEPGEEYNKLGYYRVFGSRLQYEVDGHERSFLVKSLISWRGEYYVVHLSGMK